MGLIRLKIGSAMSLIMLEKSDKHVVKDKNLHVMILYKLLPLKINEASHVCYVSTGSTLLCYYSR